MRTNTFETARLTRLFLSMMVLLAALTARAAEDAVKIDNDQVRVLVVSSAADAKSPRHKHKMKRVMIYLDPGKMPPTEASDNLQTLTLRGGEFLWSPAAGMHVSQNISGH